MTKITCNLCQKNFERQDSYKRHLQSAGHKNIAQAKFKCNICNLSYRQAAGLSRHKRKCREKQLAEKEKENDTKNPKKEFQRVFNGNDHSGKRNQNDLLCHGHERLSGRLYFGNITDFNSVINLKQTKQTRWLFQHPRQINN